MSAGQEVDGLVFLDSTGMYTENLNLNLPLAFFAPRLSMSGHGSFI